MAAVGVIEHVRKEGGCAVVVAVVVVVVVVAAVNVTKVPAT